MKVNTAIFKIILLFFLTVTPAGGILYGQAVPGKDENIPFLVTFGKSGETSWGDDDFNSIFFFTIPKD